MQALPLELGYGNVAGELDPLHTRGGHDTTTTDKELTCSA